MRLDMFLKLTRLIKRRTIAKEYCEHNLVRVNQLPAKAGKELKPGDLITLHFRNRTLAVEVLEIPSKGIRAKEGSDFYKIISDERRKVQDF